MKSPKNYNTDKRYQKAGSSILGWLTLEFPRSKVKDHRYSRSYSRSYSTYWSGHRNRNRDPKRHKTANVKRRAPKNIRPAA
eukprot:9503851-Pyramimonas_sp.AAC.8